LPLLYEVKPEAFKLNCALECTTECT